MNFGFLKFGSLLLLGAPAPGRPHMSFQVSPCYKRKLRLLFWSECWTNFSWFLWTQPRKTNEPKCLVFNWMVRWVLNSQTLSLRHFVFVTGPGSGCIWLAISQCSFPSRLCPAQHMSFTLRNGQVHQFKFQQFDQIHFNKLSLQWYTQYLSVENLWLAE